MKSSTLTSSMIATSVITLVLVCFFSSNIFHQVFYFSAGMFAVLVTLAIGLASGIERKEKEPTEPRKPVEMSEDVLIRTVRRMRDAYMDDVTIARSLVVNINVIKAIK